MGKQVKVIALIEEEQRRALYHVLLDQDLSFAEWLRRQVDEYIVIHGKGGESGGESYGITAEESLPELEAGHARLTAIMQLDRVEGRHKDDERRESLLYVIKWCEKFKTGPAPGIKCDYGHGVFRYALERLARIADDDPSKVEELNNVIGWCKADMEKKLKSRRKGKGA